MGDEEFGQEVLQRLTRVETKLDLIITAKDIAVDAQTNANRANTRLDKIDKIIFWAGTTIIGSLVVGAIGLLFRLKGGS